MVCRAPPLLASGGGSALFASADRGKFGQPRQLEQFPTSFLGWLAGFKSSIHPEFVPGAQSPPRCPGSLWALCSPTTRVCFVPSSGTSCPALRPRCALKHDLFKKKRKKKEKDLLFTPLFHVFVVGYSILHTDPECVLIFPTCCGFMKIPVHNIRL